MATRADLITEALAWLDTPWKHHASVKGIGVDCVGLPFAIGQSLGLISPTAKLPYYSPQWHLHKKRGQDEMLLDILATFPVREVPKDQRQPGDILVMRWTPTQPCAHLGILLPHEMIIHARSGDDLNHVLIQKVHGLLRRQLAFVYQFTALEDP